MRFLQLMCAAAFVVTASAQSVLVEPSDFTYLGAFRLPGGEDRPQTFAYGGGAMTCNPNGDPAGAVDGFPGSLYVMGHVRLPYGELPDGNQIAEIGIPAPARSRDPGALPQAEFIQPFRDAAQGLFTEYAEIPRTGMEYLDTPETGPQIHLAWGQHFHEDAQGPTHAWISPNLAAPAPQGAWYIGDYSLYSVNDYLFAIPEAWAAAHTKGRLLGTGRYRDGGWSGQGPALYAYRPWNDGGTPAAPGTHLEATALLQYQSSQASEDVVARSLQGYQHADEWEGGAWLTTTTGKTAVLFAGTKGTGAKYWYGWVNPAGPEVPCIETAFVNDFPTCRQANGTPCPAADLSGCDGHNDYRGWWASRMTAMIILYNPDDLARVADGEMEPWEPQPYARLGIDNQLLLNPAGIEPEMLGTGVQRRYRVGSVAYDRERDLLYILEPFADNTKPVIHIWRIQ
ncbi:MAG: hypothetical protein KJ060_03775 [Candidatus Hydrogenedentes bacterium]|nr:hypothetical protein [Candidatus Hydrogenedentota bacterium]